LLSNPKMTTLRKHPIWGLLPIFVLFVPFQAHAADQPRAKSPKETSRGSDAGAIDASAKAEAAHRFDRALKLFESGDNAGALAEFKRIYDISPEPVVLYNIGLVYAALARPVDAVDALEPLVTGAKLQPAQLERAKATLEDQKARIGRIAVSTKPAETRIEVDNIEVAKTPLKAPIRVSEGTHIIGAVAEGYAPARKEILVAGNSEASLTFELIPTQGKEPANLNVKTRISGAQIFLDGKAVGQTPLAASITTAAGHHVVELRRAGYVTAHQAIDVGPGATGEIALDLNVDASALGTDGATLVLNASESPLDVTLDGERKGPYTEPLRLPRGPHHLTLSTPGFITAEREVDLTPTNSNELRIAFEPTPETRRNYRSSAMFHRTWGWVGVIGGAVIGGGGAALAAAGISKKNAGANDITALNDKTTNSQPPCDGLSNWAAEGNDNGTACNKAKADAGSKFDSGVQLRNLGFVGVGVGGAVLVTGVVLLLTGNDPNKYEQPTTRALNQKRGPRFTFVPGPGDVGSGLLVTF
jgi:hypothetical protein